MGGFRHSGNVSACAGGGLCDDSAAAFDTTSGPGMAGRNNRRWGIVHCIGGAAHARLLCCNFRSSAARVLRAPVAELPLAAVSFCGLLLYLGDGFVAVYSGSLAGGVLPFASILGWDHLARPGGRRIVSCGAGCISGKNRSAHAEKR